MSTIEELGDTEVTIEFSQQGIGKKEERILV